MLMDHSADLFDSSPCGASACVCAGGSAFSLKQKKTTFILMVSPSKGGGKTRGMWQRRDEGIRTERGVESEGETSSCSMDSSSVLLLLQGPICLHLVFWHRTQARQVTLRKHANSTWLFSAGGLH